MITIRLFCAGGFSTGILVKKMEEAAKKKTTDADIKAFSLSHLKKCLEEEKVDVALIGPQIAFELPKIKKICDEKGIPFEIIPSLDYGRMNGDKVLELALSKIK